MPNRITSHKIFSWRPESWAFLLLPGALSVQVLGCSKHLLRRLGSGHFPCCLLAREQSPAQRCTRASAPGLPPLTAGHVSSLAPPHQDTQQKENTIHKTGRDKTCVYLKRTSISENKEILQLDKRIQLKSGPRVKRDVLKEDMHKANNHELGKCRSKPYKGTPHHTHQIVIVKKQKTSSAGEDAEEPDQRALLVRLGDGAATRETACAPSELNSASPPNPERPFRYGFTLGCLHCNLFKTIKADTAPVSKDERSPELSERGPSVQ